MSYYSDSYDARFTCELCGNVFDTWNKRRVHMLSKVHEKSDVRCPTYACRRTFKAPAWMVMHLEQEKCGNHTRSSILSDIRSWEEYSGNHNLLTVERAMWELECEPQDSTGGRYKAIEKYFNGEYYECPTCAKGFGTLYQLDQHLNSAAHDPANYHCIECGIQYKLLSALFQHLESERCGAMSYHAVKEMTNDIVSYLREFR